MSRKIMWRCLDCGLLNYRNKCQACFAIKTDSNHVIGSDQKWIYLSDFISLGTGNIFHRLGTVHFAVIDNNKIILAYNEITNGIHEYNFRTNEWRQIFTIPPVTENSDVFHNVYEYSIDSLQFYQKTNKIYVALSDHQKVGMEHWDSTFMLLQIEAYTNKFDIVSNDNRVYLSNQSIMIHDKYHFIAHDKHFTFNPANNQIDEIFNFQAGEDDFYEERFGHRLIYIPREKMLLAIGGKKRNNRGFHRNKISIYHLDTQRWRNLDVFLPKGGLSFFGCVLTNDQNYIILIGGQYDIDTSLENYSIRWEEIILFGGKKTDDIYVWDLNANEIKKSLIKCPYPGHYIAFTAPVNNKLDILTAGYLRHYCDVNIDNTPNDIIGLMQSMYNIGEDIHLFGDRNHHEHWKINTNVIINSI